MDFLLSYGIIGCAFVVFWLVAYPEAFLDSILFKGYSFKLSVFINLYASTSIIFLILGLRSILQ